MNGLQPNPPRRPLLPLQVFERQVIREQVNECAYRLAQEGLPLVLPYITKQRLELPAQLLLELLHHRNIILPGGTEGDTTEKGERMMP